MTLTVFGTGADGVRVDRLLLGAGDLSAAILTRGAILQDVRLKGVAHSLTLGFPDLAPYEGPMTSCGAVVGPVVNRIAGATAEIDGKRLEFEKNLNGRHVIHGGSTGTHRQIWRLEHHAPDEATLRLDLKDGEGGFPGNRTLRAAFSVLPPGTLRIVLTAETDAPTLMNLANHSYWRMDDAPTVAGQRLKIDADRYTERTDEGLPSGEVVDVAGTRFDYREGRELDAGEAGIKDHNFCISETRVPLRPVAWLTGRSGVSMEMATTEPGLQVYDARNVNVPDHPTNDGPPAEPFCALALEAQHWADAPNQPHFPSIVLRPGESWRQETEWRFSR